MCWIARNWACPDVLLKFRRAPADDLRIMDTRYLLILATGCVLVCATTWFASHWWYGRKIEALNIRLQKGEKARQFSSQQTLQARKQIEALQKDLAAQHKAMAQGAQVERQRSRHLEDVLKAASVAEDDPDRKPLRPANGFADTQPMA